MARRVCSRICPMKVCNGILPDDIFVNNLIRKHVFENIVPGQFANDQ